MRQSQKGNRPRNKSGRKPSGPSINRVFESSGPEGKVRGTPQQIIEKYQSLARDKATAGDRVLAESFLQHAEHYMRILTAAQAAQAQHRRDEREEDDSETDADETTRNEAGADALAVINSDENGSDIVATPESLSQPQRQSRRRDEDAEQGDASRRRQRRTSRKPREQTRDDLEPSTETAEADTAVAQGSNGAEEPAATDDPSAETGSTRRRSPRSRARPSSLDVIESGDANDNDEGDWPATSAVGHA